VPEPLPLLLVGFLGGFTLVLLLWPKTGLVERWRGRRARARQVRKQDVLKQSRLNEVAGQPTTLQGLAQRLGLSPSQTASILADLQSAGALTVAAEEIHLTQQGRLEGARVIRAHRLWERHLADDTGFAESEWHELAERQEHRLTPGEAEALARQLGQPARDPHGDPIPTADGELVLHEGRLLSTVPVGALVRITHVEDEPAEVYDQIAAAGLVPGAVLRLVEIGPDGLLAVANGDEHRLSSRAADNISVVPLPSEVVAESPHGVPLSSLRPGESGQVVGLSPRCRGAERRRMLDLGILPGTVIDAVMTSPSGDPTAYRIRDAMIALRREQAGLVRISPTAEKTQ
jgi:DtxR family Mn-dependent transcriptional regulator